MLFDKGHAKSIADRLGVKPGEAGTSARAADERERKLDLPAEA
jgi:hypothetical protein